MGGSDSIDDKPQWVRDWTDDRAIFLNHTVTEGGTRVHERAAPRSDAAAALCSADQMIDAVLSRMKELEEERDNACLPRRGQRLHAAGARQGSQ